LLRLAAAPTKHVTLLTLHVVPVSRSGRVMLFPVDGTASILPLWRPSIRRLVRSLR